MTSTTASKIEVDDDRRVRAIRVVPAAQSLPDVDTRQKMLLDIMGPAPEGASVVPDTIRVVVNRSYERNVSPLVAQHWPASLPGNADARLGQKLRFLACDLYASAPYTVLFCAEDGPLIFRATIRAATMSIAPRSLLPMAARSALSLFARFGDVVAQRRIVLIGAFIATIDHAFDHTLDDVDPIERGRRVRGLLRGEYTPDTSPADAPLALTRALQEAMGRGLSFAEQVIFRGAMARVVDWCESEVLGLTGVPDPSGLSHRLAGVEGTIDGLVFPVHHYAGDSVRRWMYDVSWFVQMMDDWLDVEKDVVDDRETPVITGVWTAESLREKWRMTIGGVEELAQRAVKTRGQKRDQFVALVRDSYISMMHDVRRAMTDGIAA